MVGGETVDMTDDGEVRVTLRLDAMDPEDVARAAALLRGGGLVAFPTETVYGLGGHALDARAVAAIFVAKGRPAWDPLIVHVPSLAEVAEVADITEERVQRLAAMFWPGPMTLLLPRTAAVPDAVTAGRPSVGVRVPAHPAAQALLRAAGVPVAAPSANRFGHVSPTTAEHVLADLDGRIDAVLDGGACAVGVESTVLDPAPEPMVIYRPGTVTAAQVEAATGRRVRLFVPRQGLRQGLGPQALEPAALPSPGVGLRHYAPEVPVQLTGPSAEALARDVRGLRTSGERVGVLLPIGWRLLEEVAVVQPWGRWADAASLAETLFAGLRALEGAAVSVIVCPLPEPGDLRDAVRDRLLKAARPR